MMQLVLGRSRHVPRARVWAFFLSFCALTCGRQEFDLLPPDEGTGGIFSGSGGGGPSTGGAGSDGTGGAAADGAGSGGFVFYPPQPGDLVYCPPGVVAQYCIRCTPETEQDVCKGSTPICDSHPQRLVCVGCRKHEDCADVASPAPGGSAGIGGRSSSAGPPYCDFGTAQCKVPCAEQSDCPAGLLCPTQGKAKICLECLESKDCTDPARPHCALGTCVQCTLHNHCGAGELCNKFFRCVECTGDHDCPGWCDELRGECLP